MYKAYKPVEQHLACLSPSSLPQIIKIPFLDSLSAFLSISKSATKVFFVN